MADELRVALGEPLRKAQGARGPDVLREAVRGLGQALMDLEVTQHVGAERTGQRHGYRERVWDTRVGAIGLHVSPVRDSSFFPSLLDPKKRAGRALVAVVEETYVQSISTRRADDVVHALGLQCVSKCQVSLLCQELHAEVKRFRARRLVGPYPCVWLDAHIRQPTEVSSIGV